LDQKVLTVANGTSIRDPNTNVCELLDGLYTLVGLSDPTVICACFDETTSQNLLNLIAEILQQASSGSISALTQIIQEIEAFNATIPAAVAQCLQGSGPQAAIVQAQQAYNIYGLTAAQIESKVESYVIFHLAAVVAAVKQTQSDFNAGNFQQAGEDAGAIVQKVFPSSAAIEDPQTSVCQLLDGVWEQANLADTTVICSCFDETTSQNLLNLIGECLTQASSGSISALTQIIQEVEAFTKTVPAAVTQCLNGTGPQAALLQAEQAYNIAGLSAAQIESKIESYVVFHLAAVVAQVKQTNTDFTAGNFDAAGHDAGKLAQSIFGGSMSVGDANADACALLNGVYEKGGLPDPTDVCACFDETTSQGLLTLVGECLTEAASGSLSALTEIQEQIAAFNATIPPAVSQCLAQPSVNATETAAFKAYHLAGLTQAQITSKMESYILFHLSAVVSAVKVAQTAFNAGQFNTAGQDAGALALKIFPSVVETE